MVETCKYGLKLHIYPDDGVPMPNGIQTHTVKP